MTPTPSRSYGRPPDGLRPTTIEPGLRPARPTGSALITVGGTRVICTASHTDGVPRWLAGKGRGWLTAEYGMLPASTGERKARDAAKGRQDGRTVEIQRLIGRSIRVVVDFAALGESTIYLDCDVLTADGGTRTASITGAYVALALAAPGCREQGKVDAPPLTRSLAAVSCGIVDGVPLLDLDYAEDSTAEVDANVVMTGDGGLVEVQATAERTPLSRAHLDELLGLAAKGIAGLRAAQDAGDRGRLRREARPGHPQRAQAARAVAALMPAPLELLPADVVLPPETGATFAENALGKARVAASTPGALAIADDSGIEAAALGGRPGVLSARYAGEDATDEDNLEQLLARGARRAARCATSARSPTSPRDGERARRSRAAAPAGWRTRRVAAGGFGYDPAFLPDDVPDGRTMAELAPAEKAAISHRGRAARAARGPARRRGLAATRPSRPQRRRRAARRAPRAPRRRRRRRRAGSRAARPRRPAPGSPSGARRPRSRRKPTSASRKPLTAQREAGGDGPVERARRRGRSSS